MTDPLRIGIVGAGFIADVMARAILDSGTATVTAMASRRREAAQALADRHGSSARIFDTWRDLAAWNGIDAVYCATPTAAREEICLAAAQCGKHLLAEKPFATLDSLRRITAACRGNDVAFMDATHFVHHPRHHRLVAELERRIGAPRAIHSSFFFPSMDPSNIRLQPSQEPTGAIGDMAWYCMRAIVEVTPQSVTLDSAHGFVERHPQTQAVVRGAGVLQLSNGCTSTWEAGYSTGASVMDLAIQGERGMITLDDFVLDWQQGFAAPDATIVPSLTQRSGVTNPRGYERIEVPSPIRQSVLLVEAFTRLARAPRGPAHLASEGASERTQAFVDGIWHGMGST